MKLSKEWVHEVLEVDPANNGELVEALVRRIQVDALRHAATLCTDSHEASGIEQEADRVEKGEA